MFSYLPINVVLCQSLLEINSCAQSSIFWILNQCQFVQLNRWIRRTRLLAQTNFLIEIADVFLNVALVELTEICFGQINGIQLMTQGLNVLLCFDQLRNADIFQNTGGRIIRHHTKHNVQQECWPQMWHCETGISCFWIIEKPFGFVGSVIQNDVTNRCDSPFGAQFLNNLFHGFEWNNGFLGIWFDISEIGIDFQLISQWVAWSWWTQFLNSMKLKMVWVDKGASLIKALKPLIEAYLNRCKMEQIVAGVLGHQQFTFPRRKRT